MKLSIIVPVYNEEKTIISVIKELYQLSFKGWQKEIIVVNDGSTDSTYKLLAKVVKRYEIILINIKKNSGKGSAIRKGIDKTTGDYILIQDADLEYDPQDIKTLIKKVDNEKVKVVYGSRFKKNNTKTVILHKQANYFLTALTNFLYGTRIRDMETCYKLIKSDLLKSIKLNCSRFEFEPEITSKIAKKGITVHEVPITYSFRKSSQGKKISFIDGFQAIWVLFKYKFID